MKKLFLFLIALTILVCSNAGVVYGQVSSGGVPGADPLLLKILKDVKEFTSPATINIKKEGDTLSGSIDFAYSNGKIRISLDMTQFKGDAMSPEAVNMLKQLGMDKIVSISGVSSNIGYVVYPSLKSYIALTSKADDNDSESLKIDKTDLGEETVEKQKCKKTKIIATDKSGKKQEAFVWNATNLKNFPIQIKIADQENEVTLVFKNPKLESPSANLFKVPEDYKKYNSMQELMKSAMEQAMQGDKK
ncbi:MAG: hypothetical protein ACP5MG_13475 [Verrucomicrobiia bacterium]